MQTAVFLLSYLACARHSSSRRVQTASHRVHEEEHDHQISQNAEAQASLRREQAPSSLDRLEVLLHALNPATAFNTAGLGAGSAVRNTAYTSSHSAVLATPHAQMARSDAHAATLGGGFASRSRQLHLMSDSSEEQAAAEDKTTSEEQSTTEEETTSEDQATSDEEATSDGEAASGEEATSDEGAAPEDEEEEDEEQKAIREELEKEKEELNSKIAALESEMYNLRGMRNNAQDLVRSAGQGAYANKVAEFQRFRDEAKQELEDIKKTAKKEPIQALIKHVFAFKELQEKREGSAVVHDEYESIAYGFDELLKKWDVKAMDTVAGDRFESQRHEEIESSFDEEVPSGNIIEVVEPGLVAGDFVLNRAKVKVSNGPEPKETPEEEATEGEADAATEGEADASPEPAEAEKGGDEPAPEPEKAEAEADSKGFAV